jgi:hypothetical protein
MASPVIARSLYAFATTDPAEAVGVQMRQHRRAVEALSGPAAMPARDGARRQRLG